MTIELSTITFTEQADIVPASGVEQILNTGIANTLAGDDLITGTGGIYSIFNSGSLSTADGDDVIRGVRTSPKENTIFGYGIYNERGIIDTGDGNDAIAGIIQDLEIEPFLGYGIYHKTGTIYTGEGNDVIVGFISYSLDTRGYGIITESDTIIDTGDGNDSLLGSGYNGGFFNGFPNDINNSPSIINSGKGDDYIGSGATRGDALRNYSIINTGDGNDTIDGFGRYHGILNEGSIDTGADDDLISGVNDDGNGVTDDANFDEPAIYNSGFINTSDGNDRITGRGFYNDAIINGIINSGTINTGNGKDSITFEGIFTNIGGVFLENGDDSIIADTDFSDRALKNFGFIGTGDGNDIINSAGIIYNEGIIETGNGDDSIIVEGGVNDDITGTTYGIYNNGGAINMGDGNDSIIANEGFESAPNSGGAWFLGEGDDYIKGYGSGDFYGGNGFDRLELTPGTYTLKKWADNTGESVVFTKGNSLMITSEFEQLIAGGTMYNFTSLTEGQTITVV